MRFKTDENLPEEFVQAPRGEGLDALSVRQQELTGEADGRVAEICAAESRILITLDVGFGNIKAYPPSEYPGIIVLRLKRQDKPAVLEVARRLVPLLGSRSLAHELWIVDEERIRVRR
jgi:predicted nuclease of predicted toxin-antitoxin system